MTVADLILELRETYGLDVATYSDAFLTKQLTKAAKKISQYYPLMDSSYVVTVVDQTRYTVAPTSLMKVTAVYYDQGLQLTDFTGNVDYQQKIQEQSTFMPSQSFELIQRLKLLKELNPSGVEIINNDSFDLIPTPIEADIKVYYEYAKYRTTTQIPDIFEEDMYALVIYNLGEKETQKSLINSGNKYFFERRGNTTVEKGSVEVLAKSRESQLNVIVKSIKQKAMAL
jgi:hypothetical protein